MLRRRRGEGLDQKIAALLGMDAAQIQKIFASGEGRKGGPERLDLRLGVAGDVDDAIGNHPLAPLERPERAPRQLALLLRDEHHAGGVVDEAPLADPPKQLLGRRLDRKRPVEIGVEHAVRIDEIARVGAAERPLRREGGEVPQAIDDDGVIALRVLAQPGNEARAVAIAHPGNAALPGDVSGVGVAHRIDRDRAGLDPRIARDVERQDLAVAALLPQHRRRGENTLDRAAIFRVNRRYHVQYNHRRVTVRLRLILDEAGLQPREWLRADCGGGYINSFVYELPT